MVQTPDRGARMNPVLLDWNGGCELREPSLEINMQMCADIGVYDSTHTHAHKRTRARTHTNTYSLALSGAHSSPKAVSTPCAHLWALTPSHHPPLKRAGFSTETADSRTSRKVRMSNSGMQRGCAVRTVGPPRRTHASLVGQPRQVRDHVSIKTNNDSAGTAWGQRGG